MSNQATASKDIMDLLHKIEKITEGDIVTRLNYMFDNVEQPIVEAEVVKIVSLTKPVYVILKIVKSDDPWYFVGGYHGWDGWGMRKFNVETTVPEIIKKNEEFQVRARELDKLICKRK